MLICFLGGFCSVGIFPNKIKVHFGFGICNNWCLHEFICGLMVVINANKILASG